MSVFLTMIPLHDERDLQSEEVFCNTVLTSSNAWETRDQFEQLLEGARPLPKGLQIITHGGKWPKKDGYGRVLTFVPAKALWKFKTNIPEVTKWDKALIALVRTLPPGTPLVLFWS